MAGELLRACLEDERDRWAAVSFENLTTLLAIPSVYECRGGCQVEVQLLEVTDAYVHVSVCADDGGWRAFKPLCASFLVYRDGRVEK